MYSQLKENSCPTFNDLKSFDERELILETKEILNKLESNEYKYWLFSPPALLNFEENCSFPYNHENIRFHLGLLMYKTESKLILSTNSDKLDFQKNPKMNMERAETVKRIFLYYGIQSDRISIVNLEDKKPIAGNTKEGRAYNRYVDIVVLYD